MFTDFRDFTKISEKLSPADLVQEIDYCFRHFDYIIGKYPSIEKIKTIGDAYLCAGGLPEAHPNHAARWWLPRWKSATLLASWSSSAPAKESFRFRFGLAFTPGRW